MQNYHFKIYQKILKNLNVYIFKACYIRNVTNNTN